MGSFYTSIAVKGAQQADVVAAMADRSSLVSPTIDDYTVVFDRECEEQDLDELSGLAATLSEQLGCPALAILNHDDSVLLYWLCVDGRVCDQYNSTPSYFTGQSELAQPLGGDVQRLCQVLGVASVHAVHDALTGSSFDHDGFCFAVDRHEALAEALKLPAFSVGVGYNYVDEGEPLYGVEPEQLVRTP